jgi:hypothetical protein
MYAVEYRDAMNQIEFQLDSKLEELEGRLRRKDISRKQFTQGIIIANRIAFNSAVNLRNDPSNQEHKTPFHSWNSDVQIRYDRYLNEAASDSDSLDVLVKEGIASEQEAENLRTVMYHLQGRRRHYGNAVNTTSSGPMMAPPPERHRTQSPPRRQWMPDEYFMVTPAPLQRR